MSWLNNFANCISLPVEAITFEELEYSLLHPCEDPILGDIILKLISKDKVKNMTQLKQEYGSELKSVKQTDIVLKLKKYRLVTSNYDWPEYQTWDTELEKHITKLYTKYYKIKEQRDKGYGDRIDKNIDDLLIET